MTASPPPPPPRVFRINPEGLHPTPGYHHVTRVSPGNMAYLAGQCPLDEQGTLVGPGDLEAQIEQVVANSLLALEAVNARPHDVVRSVIYVASDSRPDLADAWKLLMNSPLREAFTTAATLLGVAQLGFPEQLIEVELTAALEPRV
jgi:enamine deaminase RidA (YjgF/YER057c/UK114 family)